MNRSIRINARRSRPIGLLLAFSFSIAGSSPIFAQSDHTIPNDLKDSTVIPIDIKDKLAERLPPSETITIAWDKTSNTSSKTVRVSGRIKKINDDSKPLPRYAIRVVLATKPNTTPKWESGYDSKDSVSNVSITNELVLRHAKILG